DPGRPPGRGLRPGLPAGRDRGGGRRPAPGPGHPALRRTDRHAARPGAGTGAARPGLGPGLTRRGARAARARPAAGVPLSVDAGAAVPYASWECAHRGIPVPPNSGQDLAPMAAPAAPGVLPDAARAALAAGDLLGWTATAPAADAGEAPARLAAAPVV